MKEQWWTLTDAQGTVRGQVVTNGETPTLSGDNVDGWTEHRVKGRGCNVTQRFDNAKGKWVADARKKRRAERRHEHQHQNREAYVHKVLTTLFPDLVISAEQMDALFPALAD